MYNFEGNCGLEGSKQDEKMSYAVRFLEKKFQRFNPKTLQNDSEETQYRKMQILIFLCVEPYRVGRL